METGNSGLVSLENLAFLEGAGRVAIGIEITIGIAMVVVVGVTQLRGQDREIIQMAGGTRLGIVTGGNQFVVGPVGRKDTQQSIARTVSSAVVPNT